MRTALVLFALLFAQALAVPLPSKAFSADLSVTQKDKSVSKISWFYDTKQSSEKVVFHRKGGLNTINFRFYAQGVEYLLIEGAKEDSCHVLPLSQKMPGAVARSTIFTEDGQVVSWTNVHSGAVDAEEFALPKVCAEQVAENGIFCSTCESVGNQVINLGCNATASEISNLCGTVFAGVCKTVLDQLCSGACQLEECAQDACCLVQLCSGSSCGNSSSSSSSSSSGGMVAVHDKAPTPAKAVESGIFCDSCVSVGKAVISLGCNATSTEIAHLCGNIFSALCKQVLETFCSGACQLEDCALSTCCLFDLCSGSECSTNSTSSSGNLAAQPHRLY